MSTNTADAGSAAVTGQHEARQLRRSGEGRMLAGVAGGIARYLNADVTLVRVIIAALALFTGAGLAADPRGRRRPAGRRGVGRRLPGPRPLNPDRKQLDVNGDRSLCPGSSPLPLSPSWP